MTYWPAAYLGFLHFGFAFSRNDSLYADAEGFQLWAGSGIRGRSFDEGAYALAQDDNLLDDVPVNCGFLSV